MHLYEQQDIQQERHFVIRTKRYAVENCINKTYTAQKHYLFRNNQF